MISDFTNVIDISTAYNYGKYIKAVSIIDAMSCGKLFQPNTDVMKRIGEIQKKYSVVDVRKINKLHPIDSTLKVYTLT